MGRRIMIPLATILPGGNQPIFSIYNDRPNWHFSIRSGSRSKFDGLLHPVTVPQINGMVEGRRRSFGKHGLALHQQWIKLSLPIERIQIIAAAYMLVVDENLRHSSPPVRSFCHFDASRSIAINFVFGKIHTLPPQQQFGANAVGTSLPSVNLNVGFDFGWITPQQRIEKIKHFAHYPSLMTY
jgi:hypothetical protein